MVRDKTDEIEEFYKNSSIRNVLAMQFRRLTGAVIIRAGMLFRPFMDAEWAHGAMIRYIRWTYWRPGD